MVPFFSMLFLIVLLLLLSYQIRFNFAQEIDLLLIYSTGSLTQYEL